MRKVLFTLVILFCISLLPMTMWGQERVYKNANAVILGYENDTIFKAICPKTIIELKKNTNELSVTLFRASIIDDHPRVQKLFRNLESDIKFEMIINPETFKHNTSEPSNDIHQISVTVSINGYSVVCEGQYRIEETKTNSRLYPEKKLYLNLFIDPNDFDITTEFGLSNPIEVEIFQGLINEY